MMHDAASSINGFAQDASLRHQGDTGQGTGSNEIFGIPAAPQAIDMGSDWFTDIQFLGDGKWLAVFEQG